MIIALVGRSCTGKTTVARALSRALCLPLRLCGQIVRDRAKELRVSAAELPDEEHRAIDDGTRMWACAHPSCVIDGRYLDYVLASVGENVGVILLEAAETDRHARHRQRHAPSLTVTLDDPDEFDMMFCLRMYKNGKRLSPSLILNSSELSVESCVRRIRDWLQDRRARG